MWSFLSNPTQPSNSAIIFIFKNRSNFLIVYNCDVHEYICAKDPSMVTMSVVLKL